MAPSMAPARCDREPAGRLGVANVPAPSRAADRPTLRCVDGRAQRAVSILVLGLVVGGCGDDADSGEDEELSDCALSMTLSGGLDASFELEQSWACGVPFGPSSGVWMVFLPPDGDIGQVYVIVDDVTASGTGTFPAGVGVLMRESENEWGTLRDDCTVEVREHSLVQEDDPADEYLMVGSGSCSAAALPTPATTGDPVDVSAFEFRFPARWN